MKTKIYFLLPLAALAVFAVWFRDFDHRYREQLQRQAATAAEQRAAEAARRTQEQIAARETAQRLLEERARARREREAAAAAAAATQEFLQASLAAVRDESAALRGQRERLAREAEAEAARLRTTQTIRTELATEEEFLAGYVAHARGSVERLQSVVEAAEQRRRAALTIDGGPAAAETPHRAH